MADEQPPARWAMITQLLREFESYLAADAPRLEIVHANDWEWSYEEYRRRKREFKICSGNGVYLLFNADEQLRYVGVAMNAFDHRIWTHDEHVSRRWTDVIPFPSGWYFLAPALEFFLIVRLQPPDNTAYRSYTIGDRAISLPTPPGCERPSDPNPNPSVPAWPTHPYSPGSTS